MATGNGKGSSSGGAVFVPATLRAIERGISALVGRFAEPVRELGARTLGFADRLLGPRLLAQSMVGPTPASAARGGGGGAPGGAPNLLWPVPWYQSAPPPGVGNQAARLVPQRTVARDRGTELPQAHDASASEPSPERGADLRTFDANQLEVVAPGSPLPPAAPEAAPVSVPTMVAVAPSPIAPTAAPASSPAVSARPAAPSPAAPSPGATSLPPALTQGSTAAPASPAVSAPAVSAPASSDAPPQPAAVAPASDAAAAPGFPLPVTASAPPRSVDATTGTRAGSTQSVPPAAIAAAVAFVEQRAREVVAAQAAAGAPLQSLAALPAALRQVEFAPVAGSARTGNAPTSLPTPEFRGFGHVAWVDQRVEQALAGGTAASSLGLAVTARSEGRAGGAERAAGFAGAAQMAAPAAVPASDGRWSPPAPVFVEPGAPQQRAEVSRVTQGSSPAPEGGRPMPGGASLAAPAPVTGALVGGSEAVNAAPGLAAVGPTPSLPEPFAPQATLAAGPAAHLVGPNPLTAIGASAPGPALVGPSGEATTPEQAGSAPHPTRAFSTEAAAPVAPARVAPAAMAPLPSASGTSDTALRSTTVGLAGSPPMAPAAFLAPLSASSAPGAQPAATAAAALPATAFDAQLPAAWRALASFGTAASSTLLPDGDVASTGLGALPLPGLGMLRFVERLATFRTAEDTRVRPLRTAPPVEYLSPIALQAQTQALSTGAPSMAAAVSPLGAGRPSEPAAAGTAAGAAPISRPGGAPFYLPRGFDNAPTMVPVTVGEGAAEARSVAALAGGAAATPPPGRGGYALPSRADNDVVGAPDTNARAVVADVAGAAPAAPRPPAALLSGATATAGAPSTMPLPPAYQTPSTAPTTPSSTAALSWRPGSVGSRAEQIAGLVGLRAAGLAIDFIEPSQLAFLPWSGDARAAVERTLLELGVSTPAGGAPTGSLVSRAVEQRVGAGSSSTMSAPAYATPPDATGGASMSALAASGSAAAAVSDSVTPERSVAAMATTAPAATPASRAAWSSFAPVVGAAADTSTAEAWALLSLFPRSAPSALPSSWGFDQAAFPLVAEALGGPAGNPSPAQIVAALTRGGWPASSSERAVLQAVLASGTLAGATLAGAPIGRAVALAEQLAASAGGTVAGAPAYAATAASSMVPLVAASRAVLPSGRQPRGAFLFPSAADFTPTLGQWEPPASIVAATGGADAVAAGHPAWSGMPDLVTAAVANAGRTDEGVEPYGSGSTGPAPFRLAARPAGLVALPQLASPPRQARQAAAVARRDGAPAGEVVLPGDEDAATDGSPGARPASFARTLVEPVGPPPRSESYSSSSSSSAPSTSAAISTLINTAPAAAEPALRMVEALRTQQRASGDERVTLADLTLIAVASATQQLAASPSGGSSGNAPGGGGSSSGGGHREQEQKSPEAEQAEIEALARAVLEELHEVAAQARERSGDAWES